MSSQGETNLCYFLNTNVFVSICVANIGRKYPYPFEGDEFLNSRIKIIIKIIKKSPLLLQHMVSIVVKHFIIPHGEMCYLTTF